MTKREQRVIKAFLSCVESGEFTVEYAIVLIEDNQRYGWLSDEAREAFYAALPDSGEDGGDEETMEAEGGGDPEEAVYAAAENGPVKLEIPDDTNDEEGPEDAEYD